MENDEETAFMGLTDIVSNLMVLFILLTVFVLTIKVHEAAENNTATGVNGSEGGIFTAHTNAPVFGTVTYIAVMENGFGVLDWETIVAGIGAREIASFGGTQPYFGPIFVPQNDALVESDEHELLVGDPTKVASYYIIDRYKVRFDLGEEIPEWAVIPADDENIVATLQSASMPDTDLSFIVYPEGMAHFVPVYEAMREQHICFRWEPWESHYKFVRESFSYLGQNRCSR